MDLKIRTGSMVVKALMGLNSDLRVAKTVEALGAAELMMEPGRRVRMPLRPE
jgi:hypothetical protein